MGSYAAITSEVVTCDKCRAVIAKVLPEFVRMNAEFKGIFGGEIKTLDPYAVFPEFEFHIGPALAAEICHPVRFAILGEEGHAVFKVIPRSEDVEILS